MSCTQINIAMVKMNRKNRTIEEKFNFYGWYSTDHYPAETLQINGDECFNLKSNNKIIELELFSGIIKPLVMAMAGKDVSKKWFVIKR